MSHLTIAASEKAFVELFKALRDNFTWSNKDSYDFGAYIVGYEVSISLANGDVDLQSDNSVKISELDIKWKKLKATIGVDLPGKCFGGWCVGAWKFKVCFPGFCIFNNDPDIQVPIDLSTFVTSEVSAAASLAVVYQVNHPSGVSYLDAQDSGTANMWQIYLVPQWVDVDPLDIEGIAGDLLKKLKDAAVGLLPGPGWAKNAVLGWIGPLDKAILKVLDLPDDLDEWLSNKLNYSFGLVDLIIQAISIYFASQYPLAEFEDPYPILAADGGLIPVKLPIENLSVNVTSEEMIVQADIGAI